MNQLGSATRRALHSATVVGPALIAGGALHLRPDPSIVRWNDITRAITEELGALWNNSANARTVADNIKRKVDGILREIQSSGEMVCK